MNKHIPLLVSLMLFIGFLPIFSQTGQPVPANSVTIKGQILDSLTSESLPYATLKITKEESPEKAVKLLSADADGKFQIAIQGTGSFVITSQYVGKSSLNTHFKVSEKDKTVDLGKLYVNDNQNLSEVVITAIKPLVQVDLDKIAYSMEDDPDAKTNNVLEMMKKVPMITVDADENIQLKGSGGYKIYLDGKPSNMISNNPAQVLKSMPASMVKKIEVITDPGAKYDAEGVSGIINIITNKQPMGGYTGSVNAGANLRGFNGGAYLTLKYGKFGFTGNYNNYFYKNPASDYSYYRESLISNTNKYLNRDGSSSNKGNGQFGSGELSYEIDTLNLISMAINLWGGNNTNKSDLSVKMQDINKVTEYEFNQTDQRKGEYGSTDMNVDYQRTFRKKDELLTASYRLSMQPNNSNSNNDIEGVINYANSKMKSFNDADMKEHTFQLDYTTPFAKIHTLEAGAKYIIRINESNGNYDTYDFATTTWKPLIRDNDQFQHRQDILSAYGGYNVKYKSVGFKAGLRMEETKLKVEFPINTARNFDSEYFNLVPSVTFSYQYKQIHNFRLGYNMRIQRPGIWYLNPYINNVDPLNISQGNPNLDVEKGHNLNLNYGVFKPKFNINVNLFYNFMDNSIQQATILRNDTSYTTYLNIGKKKETGIYFYGSWNPTLKLRIYANSSVSYTDIRSNDELERLHNSGFSGRVFGGIQYTLPRDFVLSFNGGGGTSSINLQGEYSGFHYTSIGVNKSFLKKKLTVSASAMDVFEKNRHFNSTINNNQLYSITKNTYPGRNFRIGVTYQFGEMKQQIKKARRGITNDDTKAGEGGNNSGGGSGGGGGQ